MPAYIHHHDAEPPFMICPSCVGLPMYVKDVAPQWSMAKIDYIYECFDCGAEIRADGDQAGTVPAFRDKWCFMALEPFPVKVVSLSPLRKPESLAGRWAGDFTLSDQA